MLQVEHIETFYGQSQALFGVSFSVEMGEAVTLMGRNGMGKTTTLRSVMGLTPAAAGHIRFAGRELTAAAPHAIARAGIGYVPEGRRIFPTLSVLENLTATAAPGRAGGGTGWTLQRVFDMFPKLKERQRQMGALLSGGEQQMLAIGRALMTNPRLLILDEATEGLAPLVRREIWNCLEALKNDGLSILVVDKNIDALARLADRHLIMDKGRIVWSGTSEALEADPELGRRLLGV
ncbi:MAG: ABC transporter ATP-binding protein [Hyphomicrobiales bacterium]|mgnify:CR=1 FL=1|nr:MAG: ABC transporter ATP-binding protein [Hyphomicrobiales bacterium]